MAKEKEQVKFKMVTNDDLTCRDCVLNSATDKRLTIECDRFTCKPTKVLEGGECDEKIKKA